MNREERDERGEMRERLMEYFWVFRLLIVPIILFSNNMLDYAIILKLSVLDLAIRVHRLGSGQPDYSTTR